MMFSPGADTLSTRELAELKADARALVTDGQTMTTLTVWSTGDRGYNPGGGTVTYADTSTSVSAFVAPLTAKEISALAGAKLGDVRALVSTAALSSASVDDREAIGTAQYRVLVVDSGPVDAYLTLTLSRMGS